MNHRLSLGAAVLLLLVACAAPSAQAPPPPPDPAFAALALHRVAVGPVAYATRQPGGMCSAFIDEEVRSALVRTLQRRGYAAVAVGDSVPRSFSPGTPPPPSGAPPPVGPLPADAGDGVLRVWLDEYWENSLCGWEGPKYLRMGAIGVLYAGSPPREVWRQRAAVAEQGYDRSGDLIWLATTRLADQLLDTLPAGPKATGPR